MTIPITSNLPKQNQLLNKLLEKSELAGLVLSFLKERELSECAITTKKLSSVTIQETNVNKCNELKSFIEAISSRLDNQIGLEQKKRFLEIQLLLNNQHPNQFPNLLSLKNYIILIKDKISKVLMTLSEEELIFFEKNIRTPSFCRGIFIASILNNNPSIGSQHKILKYLKDLAKNREVDIAIEIAKDISNKKSREFAFESIAVSLAEVGNLNQAILVATNNIDDKKKCNFALVKIALALANAGKFDEAILVATNNIDNENMRNMAFNVIAIVLAKAGNSDTAIQTANGITDKELQKATFGNIVIALANAEKFDEAILVVKNKILNEPLRSFAFGDIAKALANAEKFDEAILVTESMIFCESTRNVAFEDIAVALANAGNFDKAILTANRVTEDVSRDSTFANIAKVLAEAENFDKAFQTVDKITDEVLRNLTFEEINISNHVFQATNSIPDQR